MTETTGTEIKSIESKAIAYLKRDDVMNKFKEVLWKNANTFVSTLLSIVSQNELLKNADPISIYMSALMSAWLGLPINPNLWFAYILPYHSKDKWQVAQFQMWYKWFIQLAQRSWQFKTISASKVFKWQLVEENPLTWYEFDRTKKESEEVIWYAWYFKLLNWFEKTIYMSVKELEEHWMKFSQTFKRGFWLWKTDFDAMAIKTVIKALLSKYAPLSVDMQTAVEKDQAVIYDENHFEYEDNDEKAITEIDLDEKMQNVKPLDNDKLL